MLNLRFTFMGQVQLSRMFGRLSMDITNLRKPFNLIAKDFYNTQKSTFSAEGAHEGKKKWARLSPEYERWKQREYPGTKILVLVGGLKKAATSPRAKGSVFNLGPKRLEMGVNIKVGGWNLAALHQFGTRKMPAREVVRLSSEQRKRWVRIFRDYFWSLVRRRN